MPNKIFDERRCSTRYFRKQEDTFVNFIAAFVPAIIAFAMVGAAVYLILQHLLLLYPIFGKLFDNDPGILLRYWDRPMP